MSHKYKVGDIIIAESNVYVKYCLVVNAYKTDVQYHYDLIHLDNASFHKEMWGPTIDRIYPSKL